MQNFNDYVKGALMYEENGTEVNSAETPARRLPCKSNILIKSTEKQTLF